MLIQTGGGLLDMCVLAALDREDLYGYRLTRQIKQVLDVSESALYPVLRRLKKDGLLETYDRETDGRNRRYYRMTEPGRRRLAEYKQEWETLSSQIDTILEGGKDI
ncbi:PadR family transcriptional regulator [uncultured Faecalibaculum sp.]|uniref:PadR family transcriptional regulator n=1 Tax=uncultured Faecalibaculum sp. TaxID=1729681 RepID=UPI0025EC19DF|nr:PadR family transcriptional regulator [uncultured Faecalibaculum sp.]